MLLYVVFILLPATALAVCVKDVYFLFYDAVDPDKNGEVGRLECQILLRVFDVNLDGVVTLDETTVSTVKSLPQLVGREPPIFKLLDQNHDGVLNKSDIDICFERVDTDRNGFMSMAEFASYLDTYCKVLEAKTALDK